MYKGKCNCEEPRSISINEEEKDLLVMVLNDTLFRIHDLVLADKILNKIDSAFPIMEE